MEQPENQTQQRAEGTSLTEKSEALEHNLQDTAQGIMTAVTETAGALKEAVVGVVGSTRGSVHDAVESVKHALDLRRQVGRHPWAMVVGAVLAGFFLGRLLLSRRG